MYDATKYISIYNIVPQQFSCEKKNAYNILYLGTL